MFIGVNVLGVDREHSQVVLEPSCDEALVRVAVRHVMHACDLRQVHSEAQCFL